MTQGVMVVSADTNADWAASFVKLTGRSTVGGTSIVRVGVPRQEIYLPGGGRGLFSVNTLALAVTEPSDIHVEATPGNLVLKPGGTATLDVTVRRRAGLRQAGQSRGRPPAPGPDSRQPPANGCHPGRLGEQDPARPRRVNRQDRPPGRASAPPCQGIPIAVMGHVSINFVVKTAYCSEPIGVTVLPK